MNEKDFECRRAANTNQFRVFFVGCFEEYKEIRLYNLVRTKMEKIERS